MNNYCMICGTRKEKSKECPNCPKRYKKVINSKEIGFGWGIAYIMLGLFSTFVPPINQTLIFLGGLSIGIGLYIILNYFHRRQVYWEEIR